MATNRTSSNLWPSSPNWWQQIVLLPIIWQSSPNWWQQMVLLAIFDNQTGFKKLYFFQSLTIKPKLVATNRTSSNLWQSSPNCVSTNRTSSNLWQSSPNWWQQIVLLPTFDNQAQTGGNKSCFLPIFGLSSPNWWQQIVLLPIVDYQAQTGGNKSYFFQSLTIKPKLVATNRTSSSLRQSSPNWLQQIVLLPILDNQA